jgi:acetylornithine/succinyldiaminopimelate/putrescine aminotransferase/predicted amino acid dehydrogenase
MNDYSQIKSQYQQHAKPRLAEVLSSISLDVVYKKGEQDYLEYEDSNGKSIKALDLLAGYGAGLLGHNHPRLVGIARKCLDEQVPFHAQSSYRESAARLCSRLNELLQHSLNRQYVVHLINTGSEAVEAAVLHCGLAHHDKLGASLRSAESLWCGFKKSACDISRVAFADADVFVNADSIEQVFEMAIQLNRQMADVSPRFIALEGSYHGSGAASNRLSWGKQFRTSTPLTGIEVDFVRPGDCKQLSRIIKSESINLMVPFQNSEGDWELHYRQIPLHAALFFEPVQGEGGIHPLDGDSLRAFIEICQKDGVLVVADEIQCGLGRAGTFLACEQYGVEPDVVLLSKVLGGGLAKVSAMAVDSRLYIDDFSLQHASTFAEDEFSCRVALEVLDIISSDHFGLLVDIESLGAKLIDALNRLRHKWPTVIHDVRGRGLMLGVELAEQSTNPSAFLRAVEAGGALAGLVSGWLLNVEQIRVGPALRESKTIRIQPSAYMSENEIPRIIAALDRVCQLIATGDSLSLTNFIHKEGESESNPISCGLVKAIQPVNHKVGTSFVRAHAKPKTEIPRVAFLGHFIDPEAIAGWDPALSKLSNAGSVGLLNKIGRWGGHFPSISFDVESATGQKVEAIVYVWANMAEDYLAALTDRRMMKRFQAEIRDCMDEAISEGCTSVGFGGYTSIVTRACRDVVNPEIRVTSGNSLTVGMAIEALISESVARGIDISSERVAIVGATGNLGWVMAHLLNGLVGELVIVGRPGSEPRLNKLKYELEHSTAGTQSIKITSDLASLKTSRVIATCSNAATPIVTPGHIIDGPAVVLDLAVPGDAHPSLVDNPNLSVLRGGIVALPDNNQSSPLVLPGWHLPRGLTYGCIAETLLLGLEAIDEDYSCGPILPGQVRRIMSIASNHGFTLGQVKMGRSM